MTWPIPEQAQQVGLLRETQTEDHPAKRGGEAMTTETRPAKLVGMYSTSRVDYIERYIVTEAMVDAAINKSRRGGKHSRPIWDQLVNPGRRAIARRNIAIGIQAGAYEYPTTCTIIEADFNIEECSRAAVHGRERGTAQKRAVDA